MKITHRARNVLMLAALLAAPAAFAAPPAFTGTPVQLNISGGTVNLRSQGTVSGTAPMRVTAVSMLPAGAGLSATVVNGVCVQINNGQDIDFTSVQAQLNVTLANVDAPNGVSGVIPVRTGTGNDNLATCADPNATPQANAGGDRTVADTNSAPGESVVLNGSASTDADGTITSYTWTDLSTNQVLGSGATPTLTTQLADGVHQIRLTVVDNSGDSASNTASTTVNITVQAPARGPTADAGGNRTVADTDKIAGESVTLNGSASTDLGGTIVSYQWFDGQQSLGTGVTLTVRLNTDGAHAIRLLVTDSNTLTNSTTVTITVGAAPTRQALADMPGLTPNQKVMATALDSLCQRLAQSQTQGALPADQADLLARCNGIIFDSSTAAKTHAMDELGAQDMNAMRTQTNTFNTTQYTQVLDRLTALRGGARGLSLDGLTVNVDGKPMSLGQLSQLAGQALGKRGGGASADEEPGSLLGDRLGIWLRGNYSSGDKSVSAADDGFKGHQWGLTGGVDYRITSQSVLGLSLGVGNSDLSFTTGGKDGLDTHSITGSVYGSVYMPHNFYVDAVFNYGKASYDSNRHIVYTESGTQIDRVASGSTDGKTLSGAIALGYDYQWKALTISPSVGYFQSNSDVDRFTEEGASGLDLSYDDRSFKSRTGNLTLRLTYAVKLPWGVLLPHFRGEFVREFQGDEEVFGVRFANDPFASSSNPTPPIVVRSDVPDQSYWKFAVGTSAQFKYGISAYVEYQRLEAFRYVSFDDVTLGLRIQHAF